MRRSTLDALLSIAGAVVTAVLLVASGLLLWAGNFANGTVALDLDSKRGAVVLRGAKPLPSGRTYRLWAQVADRADGPGSTACRSRSCG